MMMGSKFAASTFLPGTHATAWLLTRFNTLPFTRRCPSARGKRTRLVDVVPGVAQARSASSAPKPISAVRMRLSTIVAATLWGTSSRQPPLFGSFGGASSACADVPRWGRGAARPHVMWRIVVVALAVRRRSPPICVGPTRRVRALSLQ